MSSYLMFELFLSGTKSLDLLHENPAAHNAGITCMCLIVDQKFNAMLLTGMKKQNFYLRPRNSLPTAWELIIFIFLFNS